MGAITSGVFAVRNGNKAVNGDLGRTPVSFAQMFNTAAELTKSEVKSVANAASVFINKVDDLGKAAGVSNAATKIAGVTSKIVNPLLCVASGARVLKDDDQYSALTEEGLAMGSMFGTEACLKTVRKKATEALEKGSLDGIVNNKTVKKVGTELLEKLGKMGKGSKTALYVAGELLFVALSVCAFDIGKKAGKKITGREDKPKEPQNNPFKT